MENHFGRKISRHKWRQIVAWVQGLDMPSAWNDIERRLRQKRRRRRTAWAAAAAAACFAAAGALWLARPEPPIIPHGHSMATLELPCGSKIALGGAAVISNEIFSADSTTLKYSETSPTQMHTVDVPRGGEYVVALSDGTRVMLGSDTRLRYLSRFEGDTRQVWLEGEAWFEVAHDAAHKFIVHTPDVAIAVLGTHFNVSTYHATMATLVKGSIEVGGVILHPGMQAVAKDGAVTVRQVNTNNYTSWITGTFEFENMQLGEICERLGRWYNVDFQFADPALAARRFTGGTWKYVPLNDFLLNIERSSGEMSFELREEHVTVTLTQK